MPPTFFATPAELRRWLEVHHGDGGELWVGFWKVDTGRPSVRWPEVVDAALCFGWIDGLRRSIDAESWMIRLTPRKRASRWSQINLKRYRELEAAGLVAPAGRQAFEARLEGEPAHSSYENKAVELSPDFEAEFRNDASAWGYFEAQPPSYRRAASWWIVSAKRPETRRSRLQTLIADSRLGRRIKPLDLARQRAEKRS